MSHAGSCFTVTDLLHCAEASFNVELSVSVNVPGVPAVTVMDCAVVDPVIVPLPDMLQL